MIDRKALLDPLSRTTLLPPHMMAILDKAITEQHSIGWVDELDPRILLGQIAATGVQPYDQPRP